MATTNRISRGVMPLLLASSLALAFGSAGAATITILNNNAAGVGFNDPTPVAPVGGNPGTTLGQQRLNVFQYAANIWGGILPSSVPIIVRAQFAAQTCTATSAVLGSAGPVTIHRDFTGAPFAGHWYHQALANRLFFADLSTAQPDINATFNANIDLGCFGPGLVWYYGYDGLEGANIELLPVVLHEIGHGLGFSTTTSGSSGNYNTSFPSIFDKYLLDNATGLHWDQETAAQRVASAISINGLVWDGAAAVAAAGSYLGPRPRMLINSPGGIAGTYAVQTASFGPPITAGGVTGNVVLYDDAVAPNVNDACEPAVNAGALAGNIALLDRGTCTFVIKVKAAQNAGAIAVLVANNVAAGLPGMGGSDPTITIPSVGISQADGNAIKANLGSGVNVTLNLDPTLKAGADNAGHPLMYAPNPFASGSSVSHWDVTMSPNALMEPAINNDLHDTVDLTRYHFEDIGWFDIPTATTLAQFVAEGRSDGILLRWQFADPSDVLGITVERAIAEAGPWGPIQTELSFEGQATLALDTGAQPGTNYFYRLRVTDRNGDTTYMGMVSASRLALFTGRAMLSPPSPNPASKGTSVVFRIGRPEFVRLTVADASGRRIRTIHEGMMLPGEYTRSWDGMTDRMVGVPAGVYFISLGTSEGVTTQRVAFMR
jgi:hypothetical protein